MHKYEMLVLNTDQQPFDVYMDIEELNPIQGEAIVIGSTIYRVKGIVKTSEKTIIHAEKVANKLYVGMLSEW